MEKMAQNEIIVGLDIGTTKIAVIIAECTNSKFEKIIGYGEAQSLGLKKGVVESIDLTVKSIHQAVNIAEKQAKVKVNSAYIGITRTPPDLAVIDVKMPKMDGEELLKKLRKKNFLNSNIINI